MKVDKRKPLHWLWLGLFSLNTLLSLIFRFFVRSPREVVLYGHKLNGNLKAIYRESDNHKELNPYYFSMDYYYCSELKKSGVNVVWGGSWQAIVLLARTKIIVSDHGLHCLVILLKYTKIKFIDVWHGIPFKGFDKDDFKVQRQYDEVWVTSPFMADLYQNKYEFQREKLKVVGYARTDKLINPCGEDVSELQEKLLLPRDKTPVVLFAPTWAQDVSGRNIYPFECSESEFYKFLNAIAKECKCIFLMRRHINSKADVECKYSSVKEVSFDQYTDTEMLLLIADVLVYDWSSIAFDFLLLNRPAIYLDVLPPFKKGFSLGEDYRYGVEAKDLSELRNNIIMAINAPDELINDEMEHRSMVYSDAYADYADGKVSLRASELLVKGLNT